MEPIIFYKEKVEFYSNEIKRLENKLRLYPFLRLSAVIAGAVSFYLLFAVNIAYAIVALFLFLILFIFIAKKDQHLNLLLEEAKIFSQINRNEIEALKGNYSAFKNGSEFIDSNHPYTSDLDVFGERSLFQLINRTHTFFGKKFLAQSLQAPHKTPEILKRQKAITELKEKASWRQKLQVAGHKDTSLSIDPSSLINWFSSETIYDRRKWLTMLIIVLPILTTSSFILSFFFLPKAIPTLLWIIQFIIVSFENKQIILIHELTSSKATALNRYKELLFICENEDFCSEKLIELQQQLCSSSSGKASAAIQDLALYINQLDLRNNVYVHFPINTIFFWDLHWIRKLEQWKKKHRVDAAGWFKSIGKLEELNSLATLYFNNPKWTLPEITDDKKVILAANAAHPLIPENKRVANDIKINGPGKVLIVTGSNMAGKSTYLRTVGVNAVLALAGGPVCATSFKISNIKIYTSMRIIDSLQENASSFYAELQRLKLILDEVKREENVLFLMDEILRGTNSHDRHLGSAAVIRQLISYDASGILATHDLELGKLEKEVPGKIENYSFDVQIENDRLFFDYKIHPGICNSLNASILMKKMGIDI